ncbi:MAG: CDP-alcohol phosphatidyltransferase family protein [Elusimicrobia bacterium]|nr:CDP-alcohol phosphatidyltransferase family protein [Elusimicrobiota bacterium]
MAQALQVLIQDSGSDRLVASLPSSLRAAHRAAADLTPSKIVFCGGSHGFQSAYRRQLQNLGPIPMPCANGEAAGKYIDSSEPILVMGADGFPRSGALGAFVAEARKAGKPARWIQGGLAVAAYYPRAGDILSSSETAAALAQRALKDPGEFVGVQSRGEWLAAGHGDSVRLAEQALCAALPKDTDGYIARADRKLSIALSLLLLKTPATPNDITTASLILGLLGAWWLASGSHAWQLAGSLLLWFCCILDGCDGEVARLKLLSSPSGAAYDLWADHLAHLATFVAVPIGVHRMFPQASFELPGVLLVSGFLACGFSVWWLVLRKPEDQRGPHGLLIERVASRDYVYLIVLLAALGRMDWFLWAAGFGSHAFWLGLWWLSKPRPSAV